MIEKLKEIRTELLSGLTEATSFDIIEEIRIKYLSRKGVLQDFFSKMKDIPKENRKEFGQLLNTLKNDAFDLLNSKKEKLNDLNEEKGNLDLTLPGTKTLAGRYHPLHLIRDQIKNIFKQMGFSIASGPEVETEYYIFDALNMPEWHPARKLTDTLYIDKNRLLRTETSSVQVRVMEKGTPPFRIICPGRVYRNEKENATHGAMFMHCEGLYVNENVSFAELKGTLLEFFKIFFGKDTKVRFRPHYFPFTEPSAEVDITCFRCNGKGCSLCKNSGWIELGGCGMVHPKLLENVNIDSEKYSGFAFGLGIERLTMLKYGISDLRNLYENDLRFLNQF